MRLMAEASLIRLDLMLCFLGGMMVGGTLGFLACAILIMARGN